MAVLVRLESGVDVRMDSSVEELFYRRKFSIVGSRNVYSPAYVHLQLITVVLLSLIAV
jgi:hypothetical protein